MHRRVFVACLPYIHKFIAISLRKLIMDYCSLQERKLSDNTVIAAFDILLIQIL